MALHRQSFVPSYLVFLSPCHAYIPLPPSLSHDIRHSVSSEAKPIYTTIIAGVGLKQGRFDGRRSHRRRRFRVCLAIDDRLRLVQQRKNKALELDQSLSSHRGRRGTYGVERRSTRIHNTSPFRHPIPSLRFVRCERPPTGRIVIGGVSRLSVCRSVCLSPSPQTSWSIHP